MYPHYLCFVVVIPSNKTIASTESSKPSGPDVDNLASRGLDCPT
jgi:hypothetical protein